MHSIILVGGGGHALVVAEICRLNGYKIEGYVAHSENRSINYKWLGSDDFLKKENIQDRSIVIAIGDQEIRTKIFNKLLNMNVDLPNLIHPTAILSDTVKLKFATVICPGAIINAASSIGSNCIINTGAKIEHGCIIQDHAHIGPGVILCGDVFCNNNTFIGAGSIVVQSTEIGCYARVGAGSLVIHNLPSHVLAYGVPCKIKKVLETDDNR